ncbi:NAD-dependent protein deacylase [Clostridium scatologenes]|uniref:NAD-dependent protein deacetylase n=1 Tax=Clostridium scatologenes TaxID=1548 RepID=A0A0E3GRZ4_CLOSL|nr:NAD-dependent protein deacylase [Clostridium scatologenes]AKA71176.1 Silent information regulator protein Sir2 [Clostridium scatologenes]
MSTEIETLTQILRNSNNIVFFGGAGVSTSSGIPDFRSSNGLWNEKLKINFTPEQLVSHTFFMRYPEEFFEFYKDKLIYPNAKPNGCHIALAKLEQMGKLKAVVTQNIDGLHQAAGSKVVYELHGSVLRNYCMKCNAFYDEKFILESKGVPTCPKCGGKVKPDVVLYEEGLDNNIISGAVKAISEADTLIIGGTSLVVYPAAGLIDYFKGKNLVLINKSTTSADNKADLIINDDIAKALSDAVNKL